MRVGFCGRRLADGKTGWHEYPPDDPFGPARGASKSAIPRPSRSTWELSTAGTSTPMSSRRRIDGFVRRRKTPILRSGLMASIRAKRRAKHPGQSAGSRKALMPSLQSVRSVYDNVPRSYAGLQGWLERADSLFSPGHLAEGIVFHHPDGRRAKIKRRNLFKLSAASRRTGLRSG